MGLGLAGVLLEGVPPLFSAAQNSDAHGAMVAMRRLLVRLRDVDPGLAEELKARLPGTQAAASVSRALTPALTMAPRDPDTHAGLLKKVDTVEVLRPVMRPLESAQLEDFLHEHRQSAALKDAGLSPRTTLFMVGPPGVGKTMTAAWLAGAARRSPFPGGDPSAHF